MKLLKSTIPLITIIVFGVLYLLQSCGNAGLNYDSYVADYKGIAMKEMERTGYPASIKLAQAILESQGGRDELAYDYNNHFAILCGKNWSGRKYYVKEEDYGSGEMIDVCYREYQNPNKSFIDHTNLMRREFRSLFRIDPMEYERWAEELQNLKYNGNDDYDLTLINMIERYGLHEYDRIAMGFEKERKRPDSYADYDDKPDYDKPNYDKYEEDYDKDFDRNYDKDYAKEREIDSYDEYVKRQRIKKESYYDGLDDLDKDISDHHDLYSRPKRRRSSTYQGDDNNEPDYDKEGDYYAQRSQRSNKSYKNDYRGDAWEANGSASYGSGFESYDQTAYSSKRNQPRYSSSSIDDKYEGLSQGSYTKNRTSYGPPNEYQYDQRRTTTRANSEDTWEMNEAEATSLSDFEETYAYINGVKVTTAQYDDTPLTIAKRYNVSVKDIIEYNENINTTRQLLREDSKVFLEPKKSYYREGKKYHIVQFGDRMRDIATDYGLSLEALYEKNRMPMGSEPALGEKIKLDRGRIRKRPELRSGAPVSASQPTKSRPYTPPAKTPITDNFPNNSQAHQETAITTVLLQPVTTKVIYHTVEEGETLYRIASRYGVTVANLKGMNNLSSNSIRQGMRLKIQ